LSVYEQSELDHIAYLLNTRPRKRFGFKTPQEMIQNELHLICGSTPLTWCACNLSLSRPLWFSSLIERDKELSEVPTPQRRAKPKALEHYETVNPDRNTAISTAYRSGGYTLKQIGDYFGLHYSTVSGIVRDQKSKT